jgi:hypothetical protein
MIGDKVIIAGSRTITDKDIVWAAITESGLSMDEVVSGMAPGVDTIGKQIGDDLGVPVKPFPAEWNNLKQPGAIIRYRKHGKKYNANAGFYRNEQMAKYATALIAVWDGKSRGTKHMIDMAHQYNLKVYVKRI